MKGSILYEENKPINLAEFFDSIENKQEEYNWLITDIQCGISYHHKYGPIFTTIKNGIEREKEYVWLSGEELTKIHRDQNNFWIWCVFSGFNKNISKEDILKYELPYVDGYGGFWENPISIQHPLAEIEIVIWESCLALLISKDDDIIDIFMKNQHCAKDLEQYNKNLKIYNVEAYITEYSDINSINPFKIVKKATKIVTKKIKKVLKIVKKYLFKIYKYNV